MFYKFILSGILMLWISQISAQTLKTQMIPGPTITLPAARVQNDFILPDQKGGFISISAKRSGFLADPLTTEAYVSHFDTDMKLIKQKTFKLNKGAVKSDIKGAFVKHGRLHMVKLDKDLRHKAYFFRHLEGNIAKGLITYDSVFFKLNFIYPKTLVNLIVNPNSLFYQKMQYYTDVNYFYPKIWLVFSAHNRFFAIVYRDKKLTPVTYHIQVFNQNFESVYHHKISPLVLSPLFRIDDIKVSDKTGDVYLAAHFFKKDPFKKEFFTSFDNTKKIVIYHFNINEEDSYELKPKTVIDQIRLNLSKYVTVFGFYRHLPTDFNKIDGFYRLDLSPKLALLKQSYISFDHQLIDVPSKYLSAKHKNLWLVIRKHFFLPDGSLLINAEELYVPLVLAKRHREENVREFVGDIFAFRVTPNGKILWLKQIKKKQVVKPRLATHSFFSTYIQAAKYNFMAFTDSSVKVLNIKHVDNKSLIGLKISTDGNLQTGILWNKKRNRFRFMPIEGTMIDKHTAIIPAKNHAYLKYYKLIFH